MVPFVVKFSRFLNSIDLVFYLVKPNTLFNHIYLYQRYSSASFKVLHKVGAAQECDASKNDSSNTAGSNNIYYCILKLILPLPARTVTGMPPPFLETSTSGGHIDVSIKEFWQYVKISNSVGNVDLH